MYAVHPPIWIVTPFFSERKVKIYGEEGENVRVRELRERAGMTQDQLADKLNVDRAAVSMWEREKAKPCKKHRAMLCAILQCTERELMGDAAH